MNFRNVFFITTIFVIIKIEAVSPRIDISKVINIQTTLTGFSGQLPNNREILCPFPNKCYLIDNTGTNTTLMLITMKF